MSPTTATTALMTIGAFARRSRLSLKALRIYDELGLLPPARIDPTTGYRSYTQDQVSRARLIGLLRRLDMPLGRIARVLDADGPEASRELAAFWAEAEASVEVKRRLVAYLGRHLEGRGEPMFDVATREVPEQRVLSIARSVFVKDLPDFISRAHLDLYDQLRRVNAQPRGPSFVIYHGEVNNDSDGPVEVCIPFTGDAPAGVEAAARAEPAHREAYTTITRAQCEFPGILDAYAAVEAWIEERGLSMGAAPREVYFVSEEEVGPDDLFCDVAFPIA
jgi:DNA-binding transcriptional MerR regulator